MRWTVPLTVVIAGSLLALATLQPGLDYFVDPSGSIDALVRGDWGGFFTEQPLMGSVSLLLRAPFVALVFHSRLDAVYFAGVLPCVLVLCGLVAVLWRRMVAAGRPGDERVVVALVCLGSIAVVRAVHWGHPEELVASALAVGALLAAGDRRPVLAGLLVGAAFATKQWALLAVLPVLLVLPEGRVACLAGAGAAVAVLVLPMFLGDPDRFLAVLRAAGSTDPSFALGIRDVPAPGAHVTPYSVFAPFASATDFQGRPLNFIRSGVAGLAHPLVLVAGFLAPVLVWRRAPSVDLATGLRLLALVFLLRCVLDPMSLDYYHVPLLVSLGAAAAVGGRRETTVALLATAGLTLAFFAPAASVAELDRHALVKFALYAATALPLLAWLSRELFGAPSASWRPFKLPAATVRRSG